MPFYKLHMLLFYAVPVVFALFGAWMLARKGRKAFLRWGLGIILALFVLAVVVPSIGVLYNNGPMAAEGMDPLALPRSTLIVLAIQIVAEKRVPLPRWVIALVSVLVGMWNVGVGSYIA